MEHAIKMDDLGVPPMDWKAPDSSLAKWIYRIRFSIAQGVFLDPSSPKYQDAASLVADFVRWCKP